MKLHLPNGLRKALLACLAALALPATLPSTLATASGLAAAWVIASQQAPAADVTITNQSEYETALGGNAAGDNWTFNVQGGFHFGTNSSQGPTHNANFAFTQTLTVTDGYRAATNTFNGAFTGAAGVNLVFQSWASNVNNTWQFNGNLSGFAGDILSTHAGVLNIVFGESAQTNTGAIRQQDGGTLNLTLNGQTVNNSEIGVNNLTINSTTSFSANSQVSVAGTLNLANNSQTTIAGTVSLGNGARLTLGSSAAAAFQGTTTFATGVNVSLEAGAHMSFLDEIAADSSRLAGLSLKNGAILTLKRGVLSGESLEIVSGEATIEVGSYGEGGSAIGSDAVSLDFRDLTGMGRLVIDISGLGLKSGYSFQLFTGQLDWTKWEGKFSFKGFDSENFDIVRGTDGTITLKSNKPAFSYDGTGDLRWGVSGDGGWVDKRTWDNGGCDVNFTATEGTHKVSLMVDALSEGDGLSVGVMDVAEGTAVYNITNSSGGDAKLSVGTLIVGDGVTMNFGGGTQLSVGSELSLGAGAVLSISENLEFTPQVYLGGGSGSKIVRAAGVTDPVYLELYMEGETRRAIQDYFAKDVLHGVTLENVGISRHGEGTLTFSHDPENDGYIWGEDTLDVPLEIAEGAVRFFRNTFTIKEQVTGAGNIQIATASDDEEVMVHLAGGTDMDGVLELSRFGARLGLGTDSIVGGLSTGDENEPEKGDGVHSVRDRFITGEKEGGNVKLTIDGDQDHSLVHVEISGVDIVKRGAGTQALGMRFSGGSITVEEGVLNTLGGSAHWSTLDATSVSISEDATFFWGDGINNDQQVHGYVSGGVDIQGTFEIQDSINLAGGGTIGDRGKIMTQWGAQIGLGDDLIVGHSTDVFQNDGYGIATLKKGDFEGAAEHVHLQLGGNSQSYSITNGVLGGQINVDSSLGLYWKGNGGQLRVESSTLDEVLVGGGGKLWFQNQVILNGELKTAEGYEGEGVVYVHNNENQRLILKAGGALKSVLNGGWGTYIDLGADFEVGGLQWRDANEGGVGGGEFAFARYVDAVTDTVSLILNVSGEVTLQNGSGAGNAFKLGDGVNLEKKGIGTQTINGEMLAGGDVTVSAGTLALEGSGSEIHGALGGMGKLKVGAAGTLLLDGGGNFAGTLEMTDGAAVTVVGRNPATGKGADLSVGTLSGTGSVTVSSGKLTVGTAEGATLKGLALGQDGAAGNLTVKAGSFTISGSWTWTEGSVLRLETAGQTITLDGITSITRPTLDENGAVTGGQLTVDLTDAFLGGDKAGAGHVQLFASGFDSDWEDYFRFTVDGKEVGAGNYEGLELNSKGVLRWGIENLYWVVDQSGEELTWNSDTLFDLDENGLGKQDTWTDDSDITFVHSDGASDEPPHKVTLEKSVTTGNFHIKGPAAYTFGATSAQQTLTVGGDLEVDGGVALTFEKNVRLDVDGDVSLGAGSTLTLNSDMVFGGRLSGGAGSILAGSGPVYALWDNGNIDSIAWDDFTGKYGDVRGENVGYGVSMSETDLTIERPAEPVGNFKVEGAGKTLTFKGGITGSGSITGDGMLKVTDGDTTNPPTFTGHIEVANFIVESGAQTLGNGAAVNGTITLTGGVLNLNATGEGLKDAAVVLAPENAEGAANTPLLHVVGGAEVSTLSGTGMVTVDDGATLTLSGKAGEKEVFTGQIEGRTEVLGTGTLRLGDGAQLSELSVLGTVDVQEGSEATVLEALEENNVGSITGEGTLRLKAKSGTFGGTVSSRFTYDGGNGGTFTLSGTIIDSPDVRVESGTLRVSGAETVPGVTLAGGTLDAAKAGLTISSLTLEGEGSGLKVTNSLTVGEVKGDGALGSLNIGAGAGLTVQSGNLTLNGRLSWGSGATLTLGENNSQKFVWGQGFGFGLGDGKLKVVLPGRYLRGLKKGKDSFLELGVDWVAGWANNIEVTTDDSRYTDLRLIDEDDELDEVTNRGNLAWTREGVQWNGATGDTWSNASDATKWNEVDTDKGTDTAPGGTSVYFIGESGATDPEKVVISGEVTPTNVYVESGNYEFTGGKINMAEGGVLTVGGDPKGATRLTLSNANTSLPSIELQEDGFLVLNNDDALTEKTKILFTGGTLEFGDGIKNTDVSSHVATSAEGSTDAARVNVGEGKNVTWGSMETVVSGNGGLTLILDDKGLVKGGEGNFTLAWKETPGASHIGNMTVNAGTLTLEVGGNTTLTGNITGDGTLNVSQGNLTLSGKNTVKNIVLAGSSNTTLGSNTALGDENTTLTLSGGSITGSDNGTIVNAGRVNVEGSSTVNGNVTFSGTVDGEGTLTAGTGAAVTLSGSLAEFSGALDTGKDGARGTITLSGPDTEVKASVAGIGTLDVNSAEGVTLVGGKLGDNRPNNDGSNDDKDKEGLTVRNSGKGKLVIASASCGDGLGLSFGDSSGSIVLGNAGQAVTVNDFRGVTGGTGDVILSNVKLTPAEGDFSMGSAHWFVDTAVPETDAAGARAIAGDPAATVDMGWLSADTLDGIAVNAGGLLTNVSGMYKVGTDRELTLHFTADNMGTDKSKITRGLIKGNEGFNIVFSGGDAEAQGFHLEFDETALLAALRGRSDENTALYLLALRGGTWDAKTKGVQVDWSKSGLLDIVVTEYGFEEDSLWIKGSTKDLYIVMDDEKSDPAVSTSPEVLERRLATVVTEGQTLTLNWGENGTVHNLLGGPNAALNITDTSGAGLTVTLDNAKQPPSGEISDSRYPDPTPAVGPDTTFDGTIFGDKGVRIRKTGTGTLTVGGDYTLVDGDTRLEAGALRLRGANNSMNSLTFAYSGAGAEGEARGLLLEGGNTSIGSIVEAADAVGTEDNKVSLTDGAELTLKGKSTLASTLITGDEKGTLKLGDGAGLSLTGNAKIDGTAVEVGNNAALDFGTTTDSKLAELSGTGTLKSAKGGKVTVSGGSFSGTLASSAEGGKAGILAVTDGASFTLDNAKSVASAPDKGMDVQLGKGSGLTVNVGEKSGTASDTLVLGDISIGDGCLTLNFGEKSVGRGFVSGNITSVGSDGKVVFESDGKVTNGTVGTGLTVDSAAWDELLDSVEYGGSGFFRKDVTAGKGEDGKELVLQIEDAQRNKWAEALKEEAQGSEKNALAGAAMVWGAFLMRPEGEKRPGSDFDAMTDALIDRVTSGNTAGLAGTLAAAAGASISTLGPALAEDLHRQLTTIRNRTTTMAYEVGDGAGTRFPLRHAWIDAETGYHELDSDGLAPGYKLTGWGGTVGADFDLSRHLTAGLAFTAMYGDLDADAADSATGDMDTYYLSAFARVSSGSWIHSLVLSGGVADVELNRTVNYGGFSPYRTNGSTDGYALGFLYEVGYTGLVNRQGTAALQPIFNVEVRHIALKGYTETGSDAGVDVDDIDQTVLTFGAGARAQFAVGSHAFNRAAVLETRALLKVDMGDRSGSVSNAIIGSATRAEVESAEVGAVGVEAGVGITVPLGTNAGSVFLDGSFEFREGWTSANATLGYRINF